MIAMWAKVAVAALIGISVTQGVLGKGYVWNVAPDWDVIGTIGHVHSVGKPSLKHAIIGIESIFYASDDCEPDVSPRVDCERKFLRDARTAIGSPMPGK